jgi:hypothetical protein
MTDTEITLLAFATGVVSEKLRRKLAAGPLGRAGTRAAQRLTGRRREEAHDA